MFVFFRLRSTIPGDILDRRMALVVKGRGPKLNGLDLVAPLTYNILHPLLQLTLIAMAAYSLYSAAAAVTGLPAYGRFRVASLRVVVYSDSLTRMPPPANSTALFTSLSLLRGGCVIEPGPVPGADPSRFELLEAVDMDGFSATLAQPPGGGPGGFSLLGSAGDGAPWITVGASTVRLTRDGVRFLTGGGGAGAVRFDYRPPWPWYLKEIADPAILSLGCVGAVLFGAFRLPDLGKAATGAALAALSANALGCAAGYLALGSGRAAFEPALLGAIHAGTAALVWRAEPRFAETVAAAGAAGVLVWVLASTAVYDDPGCLPLQPPAMALCFAALGAAFLLLRWRYWLRATAEVEEDRLRYDAEWRRSATAAPAPIAELAAATDRLGAACSPLLARHYNRRRVGGSEPPWRGRAGARTSSSSWGSLRSVLRFMTEGSRARFHVPRSVVGSKDLDSPVASADQLYAQALGVAGVLHRACAAWAAAGGGVLDHLAQPDARALATAAVGTSTLQQWIVRGFIKEPERAIEKATVCYGGDVSRLLDICRARLVFDDAAGILACLAAVEAPAAGAVIVRVKNSLKPGHDSRLTGGYRVRPDRIHLV